NGNPTRVNTFQYDAAGNLTCKTVDSGMYEDYYYDTDNRMYYQEVVDSGNTVLGYQSYTFDNNSQVDSDVTTGCFGSYSTAYTYDSRRLLTAEVRTGTNSYSKGYTYDGMYCRTQKIVGGTATNYTYNDLGRITAATGGTAFTCVYDDNGNLTAKTTGLIVESYSFDWKNNLVRYQNSDTAEDMYYGYDIGSTRIIKARPEEGGGTYDVCADISGWKHFFHKTAGDGWLYAESETDGANWWWTTQYTLDNYTGIGFIEGVQTARTGFPVDIYSGTVDIWGNNRVMYDSSGTGVLNAEYDDFGVESNWSGGYDLRAAMESEKNEENSLLSRRSGAVPTDCSEGITLNTPSLAYSCADYIPRDGWGLSWELSRRWSVSPGAFPAEMSRTGGGSIGSSSASAISGSPGAAVLPIVTNLLLDMLFRFHFFLFIGANPISFAHPVGHTFVGGFITWGNGFREGADMGVVDMRTIHWWRFDMRIVSGAKIQQGGGRLPVEADALYETREVNAAGYWEAFNQAAWFTTHPRTYWVTANELDPNAMQNCATAALIIYNAGLHAAGRDGQRMLPREGLDAFGNPISPADVANMIAERAD
ncbi:MAG: hypothetical protein WC712_10950, partial [Candidatus Brocadiia bacterium]